MDIHLDENLDHAIRERAAEMGISPDRWVNMTLSEQIDADAVKQRARTERIGRWLDFARSSDAVSGREGREWRDFIHEGHSE
jgi:hypothetical protein